VTKRIWILSGVVVALIVAFLLISGLTGWFFGSKYIYSSPAALVPYEAMVKDYNVNVDAAVPPQQAQEVFSILKMIKDNFDKYSGKDYPIQKIYLDGLVIKQNQDGTTKVQMADLGAAAGSGQTLDFRRTWLGKWVLLDASSLPK
jgi:hypothetical protein